MHFSITFVAALLSFATTALAEEDHKTCWTKTKTYTITSKSTSVYSQCRTTTHTHTQTSSSALPTTTKACIKEPGCKPIGFRIDYYANPFCGYGTESAEIGGPNYYISKKLKPIRSSHGSTAYIHYNDFPDNYTTIYPTTTYAEQFDNGNFPYYVDWTRVIDNIKVNANNFTLVYSGLYKADYTGNYTFCGEADNEIAIFVGAPTAFPCGGKPKASTVPQATAAYVNPPNFMNPMVSCFTEHLVQGEFYPLRLVYGNGNGPSGLGVTIAPPGQNATLDFQGLVYPPSCALSISV